MYLGELCELGFSIMDYPYAERDVFGAVVDSITWDRPCLSCGVGKEQAPAACGLCKMCDQDVGKEWYEYVGLSGAKLPVKPPTVSEKATTH